MATALWPPPAPLSEECSKYGPFGWADIKDNSSLIQSWVVQETITNGITWVGKFDWSWDYLRFRNLVCFFWIFEFYFIYFFIHQVLISYHFIHISVYMSIPISQFIPPPPRPHTPCFPPLVLIRLFSTSVSQFLPCKLVNLYHFSRFHIYVFIHDICFSLSDLLHSVWQSLDPSTSLQIMQFRSFLWLSTIPLYICTTSSLSIHLSMGI